MMWFLLFCLVCFKYAIYALLIVICGLGFAKLRIHTNPKVLLIIGCSFIIITTFISNVLLIYDYVNKTDRTIKVFSPQIFVIVMRHTSLIVGITILFLAPNIYPI